MEKVFYHGIKEFYDPYTSILKLLEIIESGGLKSRRLQNKTSSLGFNGNDYISVCERKNDEEYSKYSNNAFYNYIVFRFCFIISHSIEALPIQYIDCQKFDSFAEANEYVRSFPTIRFSDMFDEWQVKDEISLSDIVGIGLPVHKILNYIRNGSEKELFKYNLGRLYSIVEALNWIIVNTDTLYMEDKFIEYLNIEEEKKKIL